MDGKSLKRSGERGRNRTYNLLIKSQLLCQLSYAPANGDTKTGKTNKNYNIRLILAQGGEAKSSADFLRTRESRSSRNVL